MMPAENGEGHLKAVLADWGVQIGDAEEWAEVTLRLRVLLGALLGLMERYGDDPRALVPPGFPVPNQR